MTMKSRLLSAAASMAVLAGAATATAEEIQEITVAYFLEWPMPFQYAKATGMYYEATGIKINWREFSNGTMMTTAMTAGDTQLSLAQGVQPVMVAANTGQDIQVLDIADTYSENGNCVVRADLEIDKDNVMELAGKRVAVPLGTEPQYDFIKQMNHFGVDTATMVVLDMTPPDGAAALAQGAVDVFCGYGGSLRRAKEYGNVLLSGAEKEDLGILLFDVTSAPAAFVSENPDLVAKFLSVTAKANAMWADPANRDIMLPVIAKDSGLDIAEAAALIDTLSFPSVEEQLSTKWLGGGVQQAMKDKADVFVAAGMMEAVVDDYDAVVNIGPLSQASGM